MIEVLAFFVTVFVVACPFVYLAMEPSDALRDFERCWDGVKGVTNNMHRSIHSTVFPPKPLELPEWTGRERESLRADLEAAADTWGHYPNKYPIIWEETKEEKAAKCGLFPEALEAYLEERK